MLKFNHKKTELFLTRPNLHKNVYTDLETRLTNNSDSIPRNERYIGIKLKRFFVTILNALEILNDFTTSIKIKRRLLKL